MHHVTTPAGTIERDTIAGIVSHLRTLPAGARVTARIVFPDGTRQPLEGTALGVADWLATRQLHTEEA